MGTILAGLRLRPRAESKPKAKSEPLYGDYQIDRKKVPSVFYATKNNKNGHRKPAGTVFAISSKHSNQGWVSVGYVSKQSPYGQGTFCGFPVTELRKATAEEIRKALQSNHPHGRSFRPHCVEASDASFHLVMSKAIGNWTNDNEQQSGGKSILGVSRNQIQTAGELALEKHKKIMQNWRNVTQRQTQAILGTLK